MWRILLYFSNILFCIKIVSLHKFRHSSVHFFANCNLLTNTKGQKNSLQIAFRQQTELPHPLFRSSSSKTTTIVRKQRYTRIKYTCKVVHLQKIKSFGRGPEYPLIGTPSPLPPLIIKWIPPRDILLGCEFLSFQSLRITSKLMQTLLFISS